MAARRISLGAGGGRGFMEPSYLSRGWQGQAGRGLGGLEQHLGLRQAVAQEVEV
jgi:hypothetical protein